MNTKNLMNAIGGISDKHIEKYAEVKPVVLEGNAAAKAEPKRTKRWIPILAAAAAVLVLALVAVPVIKNLRSPEGPNGIVDAMNTPAAQTEQPTEAPADPTPTPQVMTPTEAPTEVPTEIPPTEVPPTEVPSTRPPFTVEPMRLGGGHTATFTFIDDIIYADFELPEGYELRTEKGDETHIPLWVSPVGGIQAHAGYIYDSEGVLVGGFQCSSYEDDSLDNSEWAYAEFRLGHWHIMIEEMYEPIEADGPCIPALTIAEAVNVTESAFAANERFLCDAVIACEPGTNAIIEIVFDQGLLTHEQLVEIARSISLCAVPRD
ncbi:MAG: hypothetical protein J5544_00870 [Clostridia bacterium]|nr:hypothetical protein [Clostridia bacterium]